MRILLFAIKTLISLILTYVVFYKLKKIVSQNLFVTDISLSRKEKAKKIVEKVLSYKFINFKLFDKLRTNCSKLGINIFGIEIIISLMGIIIAIILFKLFNIIFKIKSVAIILSAPFVFSGFIIIQYMADKKQDKLEEVMNDFFIQFRGEIKVSNDIIGAFKKIQNTCLSPFDEYISKMVLEISTGEIPEEALKKFANKVDINKFDLYVNNLKYCNTYGGNVEKLTLETQKMIEDLLKQKKKRKKETKSVCMSLYMLIGLDFLIYFNFIANNLSYISLMRNSFVGNMIININFISIWLVVGLAYYVRKLDL